MGAMRSRRGPGDAARRETLAVSDTFEYVGRLATFLTDEHTAERDRFHALARTAARPSPCATSSTAPIPIRPRRSASSTRPALRAGRSSPGPEREAIARALARELDAPRQLVVSLSARQVGVDRRARPSTRPERSGARRERRCRSVIPRPARGAPPVAPPGPGRPRGRAARPARRAVIRYDDVALESLVGVDEKRPAPSSPAELLASTARTLARPGCARRSAPTRKRPERQRRGGAPGRPRAHRLLSPADDEERLGRPVAAPRPSSRRPCG